MTWKYKMSAMFIGNGKGCFWSPAARIARWHKKILPAVGTHLRSDSQSMGIRSRGWPFVLPLPRGGRESDLCLAKDHFHP